MCILKFVNFIENQVDFCNIHDRRVKNLCWIHPASFLSLLLVTLFIYNVRKI